MSQNEPRSNSSSSTATNWTLLILLGIAAAGWAFFLWRQLLAARAGMEPFCGFGGSGDCAALWDAAFASAVHGRTGVPVAGWGLIWGLVAAAMPFMARRGNPNYAAATRVVAWAGVAGVVGLLLASWAAGMFCTSCALTYALTAAYAGFALRGAAGGSLTSGLGSAVLGVLVAYPLVLYPGLQTPKASAADQSLEVLAEVARQAEAGREREASESAEEASGDSGAPPETSPAGPVAGHSQQAKQIAQAFERDYDADLRKLIESLPDQLKQGLADSLVFYENAPALPLREARGLRGPRDAPVRFTEFTDSLCHHCASLHENLAYIFSSVPHQTFSYEARQFPLDGACNVHLVPKDPAEAAAMGPEEESVRCMAAKAKICMEDSGSAFEYTGDLYGHREELTVEKIFELAEPYAFRTPLEECMASEKTGENLAEDVDWAWSYQLRGTPLLLVNGREAPPFGPFLLAMVYSGGSSSHPLFEELLPPPSSEIPLHQLQ